MAEAKLEIKIGEIRIELEGSSDFVSEHYDKIEKHLETYVKLAQSTDTKSSKSTKESVIDEPSATEKKLTTTEPPSSSELPETFGEWLNKVPKETTDTDKALLAGYFIQLNSENKTFRVRDISGILKEHGIKLSNTSRFVKSLADSKRIFQHSKNGSEANYRATRDTETDLKELFE